MTFRNICVLPLALALASLANGQLATSLKLSKNQYVAGEPVIAVVTITNHSGQELNFSSDGRKPWLDFMMNDRHGESATVKANGGFGKLSLRAGETKAREADLSQFYQLSEPGNFSVTAVVHMPGSSTEGSSTNRVLFNQSPGVLYWSQKVGLPGKPGQTREFRVLTFSGDQKTQIYAQINDSRTGQNVRTFLLGDVLLLRKPLVTIDREQRLNLMFLATPTMWVHCQIDTDGKLVNRQIHQRGPQGDPQLMTLPDGTVNVANSIPFDPKAAAEERAKIHKLSDRPAMVY